MSKNVKLTVIVDNVDGCGLSGEWGLSILVEYGDKKILVDTGASNLFETNMKALGLNIEDIDCAILSHAHYDHANGMPAFFRANSKAKFYLRESAAENCYKRLGFFYKYIGLPRHVLKNYGDRIVMASGDLELYPGVYLIPHKTPGLDAIGRREKMFQRRDLRWYPDNFSHEQSLVLDTDRGLVIINCCSHGGAVNIIHEAQLTFPGKHVYGLIGGLHLFNKSEKEVREVSRQLLATGIDYVCTGHCTKDRACAIMKEEMGEKMEKLQVGLEIRIGD